MKKIFVYLIILLSISNCKKEVGPLSDLKPVVPVLVSNAIAFRPDPTVSTPFPTAASPNSVINIVLTIPSGTGRKIKEITKVASSTSYALIQSSVTTVGTTGFYSLTSIPASTDGLSVTFTTTTNTYLALTLNPGTIVKDAELAKRFYFLLTLDDGTQIIPEPVRVLVL